MQSKEENEATDESLEKHETEENGEEKNGLMNEKILRMMVRMGYKSGTGLGKNEQGIIKPVNVQIQLGKRGLGLCLKDFMFDNNSWDVSLEKINVKEDLCWLDCEKSSNNFNYEMMQNWPLKGKPLLQIDSETEFINPQLLKDILNAKNIFDELDPLELSKARSRANPFETLKHAFFMNRAALKMANIDAATDFMLTDIDRDPNFRDSGPYYFADVCAGPGGFSEYILWRKKWLYKGFGLTLKGEHDFKLRESSCMSAVTFQPYYGASGDGNVYDPENVKDFAEKVLAQTDGLGVHFMMSDGGFSVEGQENLQEVLSKQLYLCQSLIALEIVRSKGHFVMKLFDIFTKFSVGLVFLMYQCFEKIAIIKPNSSRPANSERYLICKGLRTTHQTLEIRKYLRSIAHTLWHMKQLEEAVDTDVIEIVPLNILKNDMKFFHYIKNSNINLGERQKIGLLKLAAFARNPFLVEPKQETLRLQCLSYWRIPNRFRLPLPKLSIDDLLQSTMSKPEFMFVQPGEINSTESLTQIVKNVQEWHFTTLASTENCNNCNFFVGLGSKAYKLQKNRWVKAKNLKLCRGTILYGEMVQERCILKHSGEELTAKSLHVIDALRLGNTSLADLPFHERLSCIRIYCKAANFEGVANAVRIRPKRISSLESLVVYDSVEKYTSADLPVVGLNCDMEFYNVNSILLLKVDEHQSFSSTYLMRVQMYFKNHRKDESLCQLLKFLRCKLE